MSEFGDKLQEALNKKVSVNDYIWKDKKENDMQVEHKLIDFDERTLQEKFNLCEQMLYNKDSKHPGRLVLLDIVSDQILRCRAELLVRWIRSSHECTSTMLFESIRSLINNNKDQLSTESLKTTPIGEVMTGIDDLDYRKVPISLVQDACMDYLGTIDTTHLTFNFILRMGLWFTQQEMQTPVEEGGLYQKDPKTGKAMNRLEIVKTARRLKPEISLRIDPTGLSYAEFKAMCDLHRDKYSNLTTSQLKLLSTKVLYRFQNQCEMQAKQWQDKIEEIKEVAEHNGYVLTSDYGTFE
jgi:hypothetical protein